MVKHTGPTLSPPSDIRALWRRATELDRQVLAAEGSSSAGEEGSVGLSVPELLEVADEVGISPDSVLLSVAEGRLVDGGELRPRESSPLWHQVLVETVDALEVSLHLPQEPTDAVRLVDDVLSRPAYRMEPEDRIRLEASGESVSVFRAGEAEGWFGGSSFHGALEVADGRVLIVSVVADSDGGSRIRIRMPAYERGTNLVLSAGSGGLAGAGGLSAGAALGEAAMGAVVGGVAGLIPLAGVIVPAVLGAYVGVGAGILGFRRLQKWGFGKGQTALNRLARALEMEARKEMRERGLPPG